MIKGNLGYYHPFSRTPHRNNYLTALTNLRVAIINLDQNNLIKDRHVSRYGVVLSDLKKNPSKQNVRKTLNKLEQDPAVFWCEEAGPVIPLPETLEHFQRIEDYVRWVEKEHRREAIANSQHINELLALRNKTWEQEKQIKALEERITALNLSLDEAEVAEEAKDAEGDQT